MKFAICDLDVRYLENIQAYLNKKNPMDFDIIIFNDLAIAIAESNKYRFEIFLISESSFDESVRNVKAKKIFVLRETAYCDITGYDLIGKYQSGASIIGQVLERYAHDEACEGELSQGRKNTSLITFYSPEHHGAQSISALTAAQALAEKGHQVLYLNLHGFSGFEELMGYEYETDITDFMYFALKRSSKLLYKLESMKRNVRGVDFLPPALNFQDLAGISAQEWVQALSLLIYSCNYAYIVIDLSSTCQGFYEIMEQSDRIYILYNENSMYGQASLRHFNKLLSQKELNKIMEKVISYSLPYELINRGVDPQNLVLSEIGSYMRGVIG